MPTFNAEPAFITPDGYDDFECIFSRGGIGSGNTPIKPYIDLINSNLHAPVFITAPILFDVLRDFTEKTWILSRSFKVDCSGMKEAGLRSVSIVFELAPWISPIRVYKIKDQSGEYLPVERHVSNLDKIDASLYEVSGVKYYNINVLNMLGPEGVYGDDGESHYDEDCVVRIFPFNYDPVLFVDMAFRLSNYNGLETTMPVRVPSQYESEIGEDPGFEITEISFNQYETPFIPSVLLEYKNEICSGVLSRLMTQAGSDWYNPQLSTHHDSLYASGVSRAKLRWFKNQINNQRPSFI